MQILISTSAYDRLRLFRALTESKCREAETSECSQPVSSDSLRWSIQSRTSDRGLFRKQELEIRIVGRSRVTDNNAVRVQSFSLPWKRKGKARSLF